MAQSLRSGRSSRAQQAQRGPPSDHAGRAGAPRQQPQRPLRAQERPPVAAQQSMHRRKLAHIGGPFPHSLPHITEPFTLLVGWCHIPKLPMQG